ncbi:MAG: sigma-70 family RNA polymerase sigma factor [Solirubrobacterales bacterium]|nr:sigma-70 family RNA polymerase sigma factor [Solirubrobacterales bacterium]
MNMVAHKGIIGSHRNPGSRTASALGLVEERELWDARSSDPRAVDELAERYLAYAKSIAMKFRSGSESFDDLVQVASLGLVNAINRFDPDRGIPFIAFASPTITGELKRHFRDRNSTMHIPRSLYDRIGKVDATALALTAELNREPTPAEIADEMDTKEHDVIEAIDASQNRHPVSLDRPPASASHDGLSPAEWLGGDDRNFELTEERILLQEVLEELSDHERMVVRLRFREELTQTEIADRIGRSQMHVSRLLRRILDTLQDRMPDPGTN